MSASATVYHRVEEQMRRHTATGGTRLRISSVRRLALLVTGLLGARSCVLRQIAAELWAQAPGVPIHLESYERRLRRTLNDPALQAATCYAPVVRQVLDWTAVRRVQGRVVLIVDESSKEDQVHLLRVSLAYRGGSVALAWRLWRQNAPLPEGAYWTHLAAVLEEAAALLPADVAVLVVADRAYETPGFVDRVAAHGWAWAVRAKARSSLRWRDARGREQGLRAVLARHLRRPGQRWKGRGQVYKKAGWRAASVVAYWAPGQAEPLVVLTNLPPRWEALQGYGRRFWIEPSFRQDKRKGWQWEDSQVTDLAHHERLLLGLAWASLLVLCLGVQAAEAHVQAVSAGVSRRSQPRHARESLFTLGLRWLRRWFYHPGAMTPRWQLPDLLAPAWAAQWRAVQGQRVLAQTASPACRPGDAGPAPLALRWQAAA